jgi:hypothetical protein
MVIGVRLKPGEFGEGQEIVTQDCVRFSSFDAEFCLVSGRNFSFPVEMGQWQ